MLNNVTNNLAGYNTHPKFATTHPHFGNKPHFGNGQHPHVALQFARNLAASQQRAAEVNPGIMQQAPAEDTISFSNSGNAKFGGCCK